ncbi:hypothetical protein [Leptospira ilyithenensis]|uniref:DUF2279 domain-containing protein n=1 Tax=Leptospira ilyithenensis TaxID=2484901 RepID=A0A4R9LQ02_9LEPT|nr:hypothetical protein [Leptospira ilyithenensis]TGN11101.1 hypothetical protein EHS11_08045 [Leptospira ilyithenensis]
MNLTKIYRFIPIAFIYLSLSFSLKAAETVEISGSPDDLNLKLVALLNQLDPNYYSDDKTKGFVYRYKHTWKNPYDFDIYIGKVGKNSPDSVLRIESTKVGQERMWKQIFEQELLRNPPKEDAVALSKKYNIISQGLNLISPIASVGYNSWKSPLYTSRDTLLSSAIYFLADLVLVGGAYYYAQEKLPNKNIWENMMNEKGPGNVWNSPDSIGIFAALAITRGIRAFDAWEDTSAHNKTAQYSWTFRF